MLLLLHAKRRLRGEEEGKKPFWVFAAAKATPPPSEEEEETAEQINDKKGALEGGGVIHFGGDTFLAEPLSNKASPTEAHPRVSRKKGRRRGSKNGRLKKSCVLREGKGREGREQGGRGHPSCLSQQKSTAINLTSRERKEKGRDPSSFWEMR